MHHLPTAFSTLQFNGVLMTRRLFVTALAIGLCALVAPPTPAVAQILSVGPGGVQYNGFGTGYYGGYGPQVRVIGPRGRVYSGYGNGTYGYGPGSAYQINGGYRPFGWGRGPWGLGTLAYNSGYLGYSNPYYNERSGSFGNYNYSQPLPVSSNEQLVAGAAAACQGSLEDAIAAFQQQDYDASLGIVNNGLIQCPHDSAMHEFRALVLFAKGDYQQAAATIHAVLAVGPGWNWTTLSSLYPGIPVYTAQLRSLEAYTKSHPQDGASRFLQAYHYMVDGYPDAAARQLEMVVRLEPTDRVALDVLKLVSKPQTVTSPQPTLAPPTVPTPIPVPVIAPAAKPIAPAMLVGTWLASRDDGSKFELALKNDASFHWKFTQKETMQGFGGTYQVDGNVLTLQRTDGGSLIATVVPDGEKKFNFKLQGGPQEDPGLNFSR